MRDIHIAGILAHRDEDADIEEPTGSITIDVEDELHDNAPGDDAREG